jgi:hypothetical protein
MAVAVAGLVLSHQIYIGAAGVRLMNKGQVTVGKAIV